MFECIDIGTDKSCFYSRLNCYENTTSPRVGTVKGISINHEDLIAIKPKFRVMDIRREPCFCEDDNIMIVKNGNGTSKIT